MIDLVLLKFLDSITLSNNVILQFVSALYCKYKFNACVYSL
jgi:hypothetical protein